MFYELLSSHNFCKKVHLYSLTLNTALATMQSPTPLVDRNLDTTRCSPPGSSRLGGARRGWHCRSPASGSTCKIDCCRYPRESQCSRGACTAAGADSGRPSLGWQSSPRARWRPDGWAGRNLGQGHSHCPHHFRNQNSCLVCQWFKSIVITWWFQIPCILSNILIYISWDSLHLSKAGTDLWIIMI